MSDYTNLDHSLSQQIAMPYNTAVMPLSPTASSTEIAIGNNTVRLQR